MWNCISSVELPFKKDKLDNASTTNSPNLNPTENLWWKLKKMLKDKAPACEAELVTALRES